jgi:parvulin-like peptidyl-prolyl isomerase
MIAAVGGCGKGEDTVAVVNGEPITMEEFYKYLQVKPEVRVQAANGQVATLPVDPSSNVGFQAMQDLIGQKIALQLAKDEGVYPSDAEVVKELEFQKKLQPNFVARLTSRGLTLNAVKESLTIDLAQERLLTKDIKVTTADVENYIKKNPAQFIEPAKADVSWIVVRDEADKKKVDRELGSGQSFNAVALRYSEAPTAKAYNGKLQNPRLGDPAINQMPAPIREAVNNIKEQGASDWIRMIDGWTKIYVHRKTASRPVVMDDLRKEYLRRFIAKQRGAQARDLQNQILGKLKESKVDVTAKMYQEPWKQQFDQFKLQTKLEAATGTPVAK